MKLVMGTNVLYAERLKVRADEVVEHAPDANIALLKSQLGVGTTYIKELKGFWGAMRRTHGIRPDKVAVPAMDER